MTPDITAPEGRTALFDRALKQEFLDGLKRRQPPPYQIIAVAEPTLWRELLVRLGLRQRRTKIVPTTMTFTWKEWVKMALYDQARAIEEATRHIADTE